MPSSSLSVEMTGEEARLFQSFQNVIRQSARFEESLDKSGRAAKGLAREERAMAREAKRAFEEARPPLERYNETKRKLQSLLEKGKITQGEYNAAVRRSKTELDQAATSGQRAFGPQALQWAKGLAGALGITGGVAGAVQLVRSEYQQLLEVQREAAMATITLAEAQEQALLNLGTASKNEIDQYLSAVSQMSQRTGQTERSIHLRASDALSARGALSWQEALGAVEASYAGAPIGDTAGRALAGAALDLRRAGGMGQDEALGFLQQVGTMARVTDTRKIAEEVPRAVTAATMRGGTAETGAGLFAAITQASGDPTGEISRTAVINFIDKLSEFQFEGEQPGSLEARIARIQSDGAAQEAFLATEGWAGRGATKAAVEQIITGGGAAEMYAQFRGQLAAGGPEARADLFRAGAEARAGVGAQRVAGFGRQLSGIRERAATADMARGGEGALRDQYWQIMGQAGISRFEQNLDWLRMGTGMEGMEELARNKAAEFRSYRSSREGAAETAQVLTELADAIAKMRAAAEAQERAAEHLDRAAQAGPAMVAPGEDR